MLVRRLDQNGDWTFGQGKLNYLRNKPAAVQLSATRIKSFKNDNPIYMDQNIDWFNILGNRNNEETIKSEISRVLTSTRNIIQVTDVSVSVDGRKAILSYSIKTAFEDDFEKITQEI